MGWLKTIATTDNLIYHKENHTLVSATASTSTSSAYVKCPWTCELTNDAGYVVYSALGSFYIPMLVMLFFYWRIYRAAIRTTRAINQGFRTTKGRLTWSSHLLFCFLLNFIMHPQPVSSFVQNVFLAFPYLTLPCLVLHSFLHFLHSLTSSIHTSPHIF